MARACAVAMALALVATATFGAQRLTALRPMARPLLGTAANRPLMLGRRTGTRPALLTAAFSPDILATQLLFPAAANALCVFEGALLVYFILPGLRLAGGQAEAAVGLSLERRVQVLEAAIKKLQDANQDAKATGVDTDGEGVD